MIVSIDIERRRGFGVAHGRPCAGYELAVPIHSTLGQLGRLEFPVRKAILARLVARSPLESTHA